MSPRRAKGRQRRGRGGATAASQRGPAPADEAVAHATKIAAGADGPVPVAHDDAGSPRGSDAEDDPPVAAATIDHAVPAEAVAADGGSANGARGSEASAELDSAIPNGAAKADAAEAPAEDRNEQVAAAAAPAVVPHGNGVQNDSDDDISVGASVASGGTESEGGVDRQADSVDEEDDDLGDLDSDGDAAAADVSMDVTLEDEEDDDDDDDELGDVVLPEAEVLPAAAVVPAAVPPAAAAAEVPKASTDVRREPVAAANGAGDAHPVGATDAVVAPASAPDDQTVPTAAPITAPDAPPPDNVVDDDDDDDLGDVVPEPAPVDMQPAKEDAAGAAAASPPAGMHAAGVDEAVQTDDGNISTELEWAALPPEERARRTAAAVLEATSGYVIHRRVTLVVRSTTETHAVAEPQPEPVAPPAEDAEDTEAHQRHVAFVSDSVVSAAIDDATAVAVVAATAAPATTPTTLGVPTAAAAAPAPRPSPPRSPAPGARSKDIPLEPMRRRGSGSTTGSASMAHMPINRAHSAPESAENVAVDDGSDAAHAGDTAERRRSRMGFRRPHSGGEPGAPAPKVGTRVDVNHHNYVLMYDMLNGIRVTVRASASRRPRPPTSAHTTKTRLACCEVLSVGVTVRGQAGARAHRERLHGRPQARV